MFRVRFVWYLSRFGGYTSVTLASMVTFMLTIRRNEMFRGRVVWFDFSRDDADMFVDVVVVVDVFKTALERNAVYFWTAVELSGGGFSNSRENYMLCGAAVDVIVRLAHLGASW